MKKIKLEDYELELVKDSLRDFINRVEDPNTTTYDETTDCWIPAKTTDQLDAIELLKKLEG